MADENTLYPYGVFRFQVDFVETKNNQSIRVCSGAFAECMGLEATMEPYVIREGGQNYGAAQRAGPVTFATIILKRGMTKTRHLWKWFSLVAEGAYAFRMNATVTIFDTAGKPAMAWELTNCMPVKFKAADLNALSIAIGIEELHLAHEGMRMKSI